MLPYELRALDVADFAVAQAVHRVMIAAYRVEAELLRVSEFVPLMRTAHQLQSSGSRFYGAHVDGELVGFIEVERRRGQPKNIAALAVHPESFRRGFARILLRHVLEPPRQGEATVSTGRDNGPAIALYLDLGFVEQARWTTDDGLDMVTLRREA